MREDSQKSFAEAIEKMIDNLDIQLALFKEKVKNNPAKATVVRTGGSTGGGAMDIFFMVFLLILAHGKFIALSPMRRYADSRRVNHMS